MNTALRRHSSIPTLIVFTLLGSLSPAFAQGKEAHPQAADLAVVTRLKAKIPHLLAEHNVPGLSMVLIRNGEMVWSHAFGVRQADQGTPVTERTVFEAASMSKPVFAYAVLKLVEQGKLDLDRSLDSYLPKPYLPDQPASAKITARMVLTHTTGLPNWHKENPLVLLAEPGTKYGYSGEGFVYLQRVVEHIVGQGLDQWMEEQLLAPLGMDRSSFVWKDALADDYAGEHDKDGEFYPEEERRWYGKANAACTLYTTPKDYGLFLLEMIRPDYENGHTLEQGLHREMLTAQHTPGTSQRRGLGWALASTDGFAYHSGSNRSRFYCYSRFHVARGDGVVIMTNGASGKPLWKAVLEVIDAGDVVPGEEWQAASPNQMRHWSEAGLGEAEAYWKSLGSTAVMIVEDGAVVRAWGDIERPIQCYSVRKSFLSALYGIYVAEGKIDLAATMAKLEIDDLYCLTPEEKEATVADLLKAKSGIYHPAAAETDGMKERRPERGSHAPGTFWYYNNWDFNALGGIFQQQTGHSVFAAFEKDIAKPIGMSDFSEADDTKFFYEKRRSRFPAYHFWMSTRDRARFGLLCLRDGWWSEKQLLPSGWMDESTLDYDSKAGSGVGYGYMWWVSVDGWLLGSKFEGKPYFASGNRGQRIVVIPEMQLVVVQSVDKEGGDEIEKGKSFNTLLKLILAARGESAR